MNKKKITFSFRDRPKIIKRLKKEPVDVLIIGGGIMGAGLALQAAASGLRVGLVEMQDFAAGASSRSTKFSHLGLQTLKNFQVESVNKNLHERAVIRKIAPHILKPNLVLTPLYEEAGATFSPFSAEIALSLCNELAPERPKFTNRLVSRKEALQLEPNLNPEYLVGAGICLDYEINDARLVIDNLKAAMTYGALLVSRIQVQTITHDRQGQVNGVQAWDRLRKEELHLSARLVINCTGPWSNQVRKLDHYDQQVSPLYLMKGVHLVVDQARLPLKMTTYFDTREDDGRMCFAIPRFNKVCLGTTNRQYQGDLENPPLERSEIEYLLRVTNRRFPQAHLTLADVETTWSGVRPLLVGHDWSNLNWNPTLTMDGQKWDQFVNAVLRYNSGIGKKETIQKLLNPQAQKQIHADSQTSLVSDSAAVTITNDGLFIVMGGRLMEYRQIAAGVMLKIKQQLERQGFTAIALVDSQSLPIAGGDFDWRRVSASLAQYAQLGVEQGLSSQSAQQCVDLLGTSAQAVFEKMALIEAAPGLTKLQTALLYYMIDQEMVLTPLDFLSRRTNYLLFGLDQVESWKEALVKAMGQYLGWNSDQERAGLLALNQTIKLMTLTQFQ
ncbi:FAD-dependent oxidoreductase [Lactobacillus sp. DCY120]|uniref:Alpha-glycerophosphate oxidase n=1 Tax=Bombilactobacillus apium TaxID=2675299 RepID=A0A850R2W6_9LACO|nr:glycerol-3-phosphate dehydrogenase/oxidase [Bombilactobacillus apium]NVY96700.1 FAD-dependent oxidoreductase [Bombilactobacillus apium]